MKKLLSVVLCAVLLFGALCVPAMAVDAENYANIMYQCYTYLGDSISWGYGLDPNSDNHDPYSVGARVEGSFTDLVADVLEQNNGTVIHPAASSGSRLCDFRILLERGMGVENPYDRENDWYGNRHPERTERLREMGPQFCEWLRESDLVTLQAGINDLTAALVNAASATGIVDLNQITQISDASGVAAYLKTVMRNLAQDPNVLGNLVGTFHSEVEGIRVNAAEVVKDIVKLTPENATILIVGYHKAAQGFRVIPDTDFSPIFDLIDAALISLNDYFASVASNYPNVYYVDAPDASVFFPAGTTLVDALKQTDKILWGIHPDAAGHDYIAQCVLNELNALNTCRHTHTAKVGPDVKLPFGWKHECAEVCTDCGKVLNLGKTVTPDGSNITVPTLTITNAADNVRNAVSSIVSRITLGLFSRTRP